MIRIDRGILGLPRPCTNLLNFMFAVRSNPD
jgi:hypothetical protein